MFVLLWKDIPLNILKRFQQSYLITKQKLNEDNLVKRKIKKSLKLNYQQIK